MMDEIEKLRLQLEDQKKPRPPNGLFWDRKDIAELENARDQSRAEADECRRELAKLQQARCACSAAARVVQSVPLSGAHRHTGQRWCRACAEPSALVPMRPRYYMH